MARLNATARARHAAIEARDETVSGDLYPSNRCSSGWQGCTHRHKAQNYPKHRARLEPRHHFRSIRIHNSATPSPAVIDNEVSIRSLCRTEVNTLVTVLSRSPTAVSMTGWSIVEEPLLSLKSHDRNRLTERFHSRLEERTR
jgi:hypothetical protein